MKLKTPIVVAVLLIAVVGFWKLREAGHRKLELDRIRQRERWIAVTINSLDKGDGYVSLYSCINTNVLLRRIEGRECFASPGH